MVAPWSSRYPDVEYDGEVHVGATAAQGLVEASKEADLMIIGGRRHAGGEPGMAIGSVTHTLLRQAGCPLTVVPIG